MPYPDVERCPQSVLLSPIKPGCFPNSFVKIAQQAADHIPLIGPPDLNIPVLINPNDGIGFDSDRCQVLAVQLSVIDDFVERITCHLDELHFSCPFRE